jgi:TonB family protein
MINKDKIFDDQGCLTQFAVEAFMKGELSSSDTNSIRRHSENCQLCKDALEGAEKIADPEVYFHAINELKTSWLEKREKNILARNRSRALILSIAAVAVILISVVSLIRYQKQIRSNVLAQLTEQGTSIDDALSEFDTYELSTQRIIFNSPDREDSAREEYRNSGQYKESVLPVAQIEETKVYSDIEKYNYYDIVTSKPHSISSNKRQLRSPFRVMSRPPANKHYSIPDEASDRDDIFVVVEDMPQFRDGDFTEFRKYILSKIRYPQQAISTEVSGRVYVQFIINKEGNLTDARIIKSDNSILEKEVLRVISESPKWTPGKQRGRPVDVSLIMPVDFILR